MGRVKLKPCPFCGAQPVREKSIFQGEYFWTISCENEKCKVQPFTDSHVTSSVVTKEWNKRAAADPVVHAHWNESSDYTGTCYAECSRCGLLWWIDEGTAEENEMFYCPKCGAKMDEEVSE